MARFTLISRIERKRKYLWPEAQLNFWLLIMMISGSVILGISTYFMTVNDQLRAGQIWLFPFSISTGALTILFLGIVLLLVGQRQLIPNLVILGCFILFVLYLTGLIETSIQLYGPTGSVNSYCNAYRPSVGFAQGQGTETLAYLQTKSICDSWKAVFSFYLIGCVFLLWMMVISWQVSRDEYD